MVIQHAAICGIATESVWASSTGFNVTPEEIKKLMSNRANFSKCGPFIAGKKCMMLRDDLDEEKMYTLQLRTSTDAEGNNYSVCVGKTLSALIIVQGYKDVSGGPICTKLYKIVDYLREQNI
ncbi:Profilin isoform 2 [Scophthalmus maximus]|nr:Profilin isoform 2 [Scophthalmus maximus]